MLWNKEIRSCVILYLIIAAVSAAVGFMLGTASGVHPFSQCLQMYLHEARRFQKKTGQALPSSERLLSSQPTPLGGTAL